MSSAEKLNFKTLCPQCGGALHFSTQASVFAVCPYCKTTVSRDADTVTQIGQAGTLLEDYSPIQIGVTGVYDGDSFTVIGREQLRYSGGFWNEWCIAFNDGSSGWLSDASGQYAVMKLIPSNLTSRIFNENKGIHPPNDFKKTMIGEIIRLMSEKYYASDKRVCQRFSAEGELLRRPDLDNVYVIDYRSTNHLLTLDYTEGSPPTSYLGRIVTLNSLQVTGLRSSAEILEHAGQAKGKILPLSCPQCGSPISIIKGCAEIIVCPTCGSTVTFTGELGQVIATQNNPTKINTALKLGEVFTINKVSYTVIGLLYYKENMGSGHWVEYLLFNTEHGFLWLVDDDSIWSISTVCDQWPVFNSLLANEIEYESNTYTRRYSNYSARILYAEGAFNWTPKLGEQSRFTDFRCLGDTVSCQQSDSEMLWTFNKRLSANQINTIVGRTVGRYVNVFEHLETNHSSQFNDSYDDDSYDDSYDDDDDEDAGARLASSFLFIMVVIVILVIIVLISSDDSSSSWGGGYGGSYSGRSWGGGGGGWHK